MLVTIIKICLSLILLLCLFNMPYGYYQIARFIGMLGFAILAYLLFQERKQAGLEVIIYAGLALLFQPFIKVALGRMIWNIVDIIVASGLIISLFKNFKRSI